MSDQAPLPPEDSPPVPPPVPPQQPYAPGQGPGPGQGNLGQDAGARLLLPVGRSIWAIVAGYLGLFALLVVPAPLALITGIVAVMDIRKSVGTANPKHGLGRAWFAIIMGFLGTAFLALILIMAAIAD